MLIEIKENVKRVEKILDHFNIEKGDKKIDLIIAGKIFDIHNPIKYSQ